MALTIKKFHIPALAALVAGVLLVGMEASIAGAQTVLHACYVPKTGTVYRIKATDTDETCKKDTHVEFSWTDGVGADHGVLSGLADDDHPQYLIANGVRHAINGFAVSGSQFAGTLPASGGGSRLMWYPRRGAFRAGIVFSDQWDDAKIGEFSVAMGGNTTASGSLGATAIGWTTVASGDASLAAGNHTVASGSSSFAMGQRTTASGFASVAMGEHASTDGQGGSFVFGDLSQNAAPQALVVKNTAPNQFMVRASGGTIFFSNATLTAGVSLAPGAGAWAAVSDVNRKTHFRAVDSDSVLARIARLSIQEWSYQAQDSSIRHLGPTAQDFHAAFGLGESDTTITTTDIDGINLLAVQALERRTAELRSANDRLRAENSAQRTRLEALEARMIELKALREELATLRSEIEEALRLMANATARTGGSP